MYKINIKAHACMLTKSQCARGRQGMENNSNEAGGERKGFSQIICEIYGEQTVK